MRRGMAVVPMHKVQRAMHAAQLARCSARHAERARQRGAVGEQQRRVVLLERRQRQRQRMRIVELLRRRRRLGVRGDDVDVAEEAEARVPCYLCKAMLYVLPLRISVSCPPPQPSRAGLTLTSG
jgi:hypothetical protein